MTEETTPEARIAEWADMYGGSLKSWPEDARRHAEATLDGSAEARALLAQAQSLDEILDDFAKETAVEPPSPALMARILTDAASVSATPPKQSKSPAPKVRFGWLHALLETRLGPVTACLGGAVFGVWLGVGGAGEVAAEATMLVLNEDFVMGLYTGGDVETALSEIGLAESEVIE